MNYSLLYVAVLCLTILPTLSYGRAKRRYHSRHGHSRRSKVSSTANKYHDEIIYTDFAPHCTDDMEYSINSNERYRIYGSLPVQWTRRFNISDKLDIPQSSYLTYNCSFELTAPEGRTMSISFSDLSCNNWPNGCTLIVYNGNASDIFSADDDVSTLLAVNDDEALDDCSQSLKSEGNAIFIEVQSCFKAPSQLFNFSLTVVLSSPTPQQDISIIIPILVIAFVLFMPLAIISILGHLKKRGVICQKTAVIPTAQQPPPQPVTIHPAGELLTTNSDSVPVTIPTSDPPAYSLYDESNGPSAPPPAYSSIMTALQYSENSVRWAASSENESLKVERQRSTSNSASSYNITA